MPLVDSHCHLDFSEFQGDIQVVLQNAKNDGLVALQTICTNLQNFAQVYEITKLAPFVYCSVGQHPAQQLSALPVTANTIMGMCEAEKVIGIGEVGLDYYNSQVDTELQKTRFVEHIIAAQELNMPLIIHSRNADADLIDILIKHKKRKDFSAVLHCFASTEELALKAIEMGLYVSASGIVTFKNAQQLQKIFANIPLERLLLETDAPYLSPVPMRGKRNEPSFVKHIASFLANLRNEPYDTICNVTTDNFFTLFNKASVA
ncbi:TatD family deoxyribonuclease [Rickettsiales endosymbiont of Peranema trichophorum]|uniref:TatD family hydrolase n=1 Tax=Rickettsiales endosymbiont of Peranema trichophorum TaxID=2486577 RepID=UPI0010238D75|nr:TatD family hydrolase [Rickettsiales endosymbiont of Peranema trichophorum]RZI47790.1 TatD family deoxyribonuclease [Rickettsiales endosymbiont of Peranema trichophorum]